MIKGVDIRDYKVGIVNGKKISFMPEDEWFYSHQELLLRILQSKGGRDLLCIPQDFPVICRIEKSGITGFLGYKEDKLVLLSRFYSGAKYGHIIRHRWAEFQKLSKRFYSHPHVGMTEIYKDGIVQLAATTSTFYPSPGNNSPVDGVTFDGTISMTWAQKITGVGSGASATGTEQSMVYYQSSATTDRFDNLARSPFLFDTAIIGTDTKVSAEFNVWGSGKSDGNGSAPDINVVSSNPASDSTLVASDFNSFGSTVFSTAISYVSWSTSGYNTFIFNASGISAINGASLTKLGLRNENYDINAVMPSWVSNQLSNFIGRFADSVGSEPYLEVVHETANGYPRFGGSGIRLIDRKKIGGADPHIIN